MMSGTLLPWRTITYRPVEGTRSQRQEIVVAAFRHSVQLNSPELNSTQLNSTQLPRWSPLVGRSVARRSLTLATIVTCAINLERSRGPLMHNGSWRYA